MSRNQGERYQSFTGLQRNVSKFRENLKGTVRKMISERFHFFGYFIDTRRLQTAGKQCLEEANNRREDTGPPTITTPSDTRYLASQSLGLR